MINFDFDSNTLCALKKIYDASVLSSVSVYFVGGMVRDAVMGKKIKDIDILVEGSAIDFTKNIKDINTKSIHPEFNTIKAIINGIEIDFASTRKEIYPQSGCLPLVLETGISIEDDLKRRDFTVNSIAVKIESVDNKIEYKLIDPFNGVYDIEQKTLKILYDDSFIDDPTRILRGINFMYRFGFKFDNFAQNRICEYLKSPDRKGLSIERINLTLKKLFSDVTSFDAYRYITDNKIYKIWQDNCPDIYNIETAINDFDIKDANLKAVIYIKSLSQLKIENIKTGFENNYEIYKAFEKINTVNLVLHYAKYNDKNALKYYRELKGTKPLINGKDLINLGYSEGKNIGIILDKILEHKLNFKDSLSTKEDEINFVKKSGRNFI